MKIAWLVRFAFEPALRHCQVRVDSDLAKFWNTGILNWFITNTANAVVLSLNCIQFFYFYLIPLTSTLSEFCNLLSFQPITIGFNSSLLGFFQVDLNILLQLCNKSLVAGADTLENFHMVLMCWRVFHNAYIIDESTSCLIVKNLPTQSYLLLLWRNYQ